MSDTPNVTRGSQTDYKRLFKSNPDSALIRPITLQAGYGTVELGTALAKNGSAAGNIGKYIPYDPHATITGAEAGTGRAYLVQNSGTTASTLYVSMDDSYKFSVGDDVMIQDDTTSAENLGAITAIDVTTYSHMAIITVTTATGGTSFTTARFAYLCCEGAKTAVGVLQQTRDTGAGSAALGALGSSILSNALLYNGMLTNMDSNARTDLSASVDGQYLKL